MKGSHGVLAVALSTAFLGTEMGRAPKHFSLSLSKDNGTGTHHAHEQRNHLVRTRSIERQKNQTVMTKSLLHLIFRLLGEA